MARAFAATGRVFAADQRAGVERALDSYAAKWIEASRDACAATRVRGEQSAQMLELREACLASRRQDLGALVDVLAAADGPIVEKAVIAAEGLPRLDACADVDRLAAPARAPADPATRGAVVELEGEIAKARALHRAGKRLAALELLRSIEARVEETHHARLVQEWVFRVAGAEERHDEKASVDAYLRAITLAEASRLDEEKADAEIDYADFEGSWRGHSAEAHRWFQLARATIARAGGNALLEVSCDLYEAWSYQYEHKVPEARRLFARVVERADFAQQPFELRANAYSGLAEVASSEGRSDEAAANGVLAVGTLENELGKQHPMLSGYLNNLAMSQLAAGLGADALSTMTRGLAMLDDQAKRGDIPDTSADLGLAEHSMGEVLIGVGRPSEAVPHLMRARSIYKASHGSANSDVAYADNELADALRQTGRVPEARRWLDEASAIEARSTDVPAAVVAGTLAGRAQLELDAGHAAAGFALAQRAAAQVDDGNSTAAERAAVARVMDRARKLAGR